MNGHTLFAILTTNNTLRELVFTTNYTKIL